MPDMTIDVFAEQPFGKVAMDKMINVSNNFRLYEAGWFGGRNQRNMMKVSGAEFRQAKSGENQGKLSVMIKNTKQTVFIANTEIDSYTIK